MFTGLVQAVGVVRAVSRSAAGAAMSISHPFGALALGESIAVNGVCLSVTAMPEGSFTCDASLETLSKTTLGSIERGSAVHLERALRVGDRMGGHLVSGHVDGVGRVVAKSALGEALKMTFEVPAVLARFFAPKGSVTIDGISLTVNGATGTTFDVVLVPITRAETRLDQKAVGDSVNLEIDVLAKYIARLLGQPGVDGIAPENPGLGASDGVDLDLLRRAGYL
jgi:riboflavin synthase